MECPKCHSIIDDNAASCPYCHKVFLLECPNCHTLGESSVCKKCGYTILVKCSKCSRVNPITKEKCSKCGLPTVDSLAFQESESDDFASITVSFESLAKIRKLLGSQELYSKFFFKVKNLLNAQLTGFEGKVIAYNNKFVINFNKELSFPTSCNKATRLAIKIINSFVELNNNILEELKLPLGLTLTISKKSSRQLQELISYKSNVKVLNTTGSKNKYLKGFKIILDQYVTDEVNKDFKTDSLYSIEHEGKTIMFYEIILDSYILPPEEKEDFQNNAQLKNIPISKADEEEEKDIYSFKVFDINAKSKFEKLSNITLTKRLGELDLAKDKIISIRSEENVGVNIEDIEKSFINLDQKVITVTCTKENTYNPWGFFKALFKANYELGFINKQVELNKISQHKEIAELILGQPVNAMTPEDARFAYMEAFTEFLKTLKNTVIIVDGYEYLDDTSIQTLSLYFDKFKHIIPTFVFVMDRRKSLHSKFKSLLTTTCYTELTLTKSSMDSLLSTIKLEATDFIQSFYYEKIKENFKGSYLYFENALSFLKESGVIVEFDNKLIVKNKKSVIVPKKLDMLLKSRIKLLSKNQDASLILAYMSMLGEVIDFETLELLGIKDIKKNVELLASMRILRVKNDLVYMNNYNFVSEVIRNSLKKEVEQYLAKNILANIGKYLDDTIMHVLTNILNASKEEYLVLWKNSQFAIATGDYDAYLKNCLGFLSLVEKIDSTISKEDIENNKKEVYNNILQCLYNYSPAKIYFIENILLMDAIELGDNDKIVKLSNLMLQGALIESNYTDALGLLYNILSRMPNATLYSNGVVNKKFVLLSLVNIEILYNIGDYRQCVEVGQNILSVMTRENIEEIKPVSFSTNLFVSHIMETFRLVGFAKLHLMDEDLEEFLENIANSLGTELPEQEAILAIRDYLKGGTLAVGNLENSSAFSKVVLLILQEISDLSDDYKKFAQNIYQAKLLSSDIHQKEIELLCDLLIAYAYSKIGIIEKANSIYVDVLQTAEKYAVFNIIAIAKYFIVKQKLSENSIEDALLLINDTLTMIQKYNNQPKILYATFEKLYIDIAKEQNLTSVDIESEELKLLSLKESLARILK